MKFDLFFHLGKIFYFLLFFSTGALALKQTYHEGSDRAYSFTLDRSYLKSQSSIFYLKGETALLKKQKLKALDFFKKSLFYDSESLFLREKIAKIYLSENLFAEALKEYNLILSKDSSYVSAQEKRAQIYASSGLDEEALEEYEILVKQQASNPDFKIQKALQFFHSEKWAESLKIFKGLEALDMDSAKKVEVILVQAYLYEKLKKPNDKSRALLRAEKESMSAESLFKVAEFYQKREAASSVFSLLKRHQDREGFRVPLTRALLFLYKSSGNDRESLVQLEKLKKWGALEGKDYFDMASFLIENEREKEAIPFLEDFLREFPSSDLSWYLLGALYEKESQLNKALTVYQNILPASSYFVSAKMRMTYIHYRNGDLKTASRILKPLVFKSRRDSEPLLFYAKILWKAGSPKEALSVLSRGVQFFRDQDKEEVLFLRGVYSYKAKAKSDRRALEDIKGIVNKNPYHAEALNFLAYSYAEQNLFLDEAKELATQALKLNSESAFFMDTMGFVLYKKGLFKEALHYFKEAFLKNDKEKSIVEHLAKTYAKLKDFKNSEFFFKKKLELERNENNSLQVESGSFYQPLFSQKNL